MHSLLAVCGKSIHTGSLTKACTCVTAGILTSLKHVSQGEIITPNNVHAAKHMNVYNIGAKILELNLNSPFDLSQCSITCKQEVLSKLR